MIDLNCDLGEGAGRDAELIPLITSANIACGAHAGDEATMRSTVRLALRAGVAIGAHPGFEDREHFGRREMELSHREIVDLVTRQISALQKIAAEEGAVFTHVKPHGALYNRAAKDPAVAAAVADAVAKVSPAACLYGLAGSHALTAGRAAGLRTAAEVFADRSYQRDGALTPRSQANALITGEATAIAQVLRMTRDGVVRATDGTEVRIAADTLCLHGDGAHAVVFARALRETLAREGVRLRSLAA